MGNAGCNDCLVDERHGTSRMSYMTDDKILDGLNEKEDESRYRIIHPYEGKTGGTRLDTFDGPADPSAFQMRDLGSIGTMKPRQSEGLPFEVSQSAIGDPEKDPRLASFLNDGSRGSVLFSQTKAKQQFSNSISKDLRQTEGGPNRVQGKYEGRDQRMADSATLNLPSRKRPMGDPFFKGSSRPGEVRTPFY